jgi:hypothetical protein
VTTIGESAFFGCPIVEATMPAYAISDIPQDSLKTVEITSGTYIDKRAFYECTTLTSVTILNGVKAIDDYAFAYCGSLKSIALPDSVSVIYEAAFCGCTGLTNVFYTGTEEQWKKIPIVTRDNYDLTRAKIYYNCVSIEIDENGVEYVVTTDGKTVVGYSGTETELVLGNDVTAIGVKAFYGCTGLTSIVIPDSVTTIGYYAFYGCTGLTSVTFGENSQLTTIDDNAFYNCTSLTSIVIPDSVTTIGIYAFYGCTDLTSIVIPDSVTTIGYYAFYGCTDLTSIVIPDSVTEIDGCAFGNCDRLTYINFKGTEEQWNAITISYGNEAIENAIIYYNYDPEQN